jgi:hypothetical protein
MSGWPFANSAVTSSIQPVFSDDYANRISVTVVGFAACKRYVDYKDLHVNPPIPRGKQAHSCGRAARDIGLSTAPLLGPRLVTTRGWAGRCGRHQKGRMCPKARTVAVGVRMCGVGLRWGFRGVVQNLAYRFWPEGWRAVPEFSREPRAEGGCQSFREGPDYRDLHVNPPIPGCSSIRRRAAAYRRSPRCPRWRAHREKLRCLWLRTRSHSAEIHDGPLLRACLRRRHGRMQRPDGCYGRGSSRLSCQGSANTGCHGSSPESRTAVTLDILTTRTCIVCHGSGALAGRARAGGLALGAAAKGCQGSALSCQGSENASLDETREASCQGSSPQSCHGSWEPQHSSVMPALGL